MDNSEMPAEAERPDAVPMQGGPAKFVREIDEYLAQTFDTMAQIDESYGKVSSVFTDLADQVVGDRDYEQMSKDDQKLANACMAASLAVASACAVVKGIKETMALEKVKRLHRKVAEDRYKSIDRMIGRAQSNHESAAATLARHNSTQFRVSEIKNNLDDIANMLESELCQYRDARFRLDMLLWLKDEYEAWLEGRLYSDTPMPTMGQVSVAAIYVLNSIQMPYSKEKREKDLATFGHKLLGGIKQDAASDGKDYFSAFEILALIDSQLAAVLEHSCMDKDYQEVDPDNLVCKRLYATLYANSADNSLGDALLLKNPVTADSNDSLIAFNTMKSEHEAGENRAEVSGLLLIAAAVLPIWQLGWAWYWMLTLSVIAAVLVAKMFPLRSMNRMDDNLLNKFDMMTCNYRYSMASMAGLIEPKSKVKDMVQSRNGFWGGLIIGALIGIVGGLIGMIIGAVIGAFLGGDSSHSDSSHGEGWQAIKICSPAKQWASIVIAAALVLFEIYVIFIK